MYYYIKGKLALKGSNYIVVDAAGVGYMVYTSADSLEKAGAVGSEITMYTYLNVHEDIMELYGFITQEEKEMFLRLISVSSVGPKAAIAILSVLTPPQLAAAIITGNAKQLTKAQGVGPKGAQRIILELKDKIDTSGLEAELEEGALAENGEILADAKAEAMSALVVLGYSAQEARTALAKLDGTLTTEQLIKQALAKLM